jgi:hypothetical protein
MVKQHRFTVYTQDATREILNLARRREFVWKLSMGSIVEPNAKVKMAIESIHCRDMSNVLVDNVDDEIDYDINANNTANQVDLGFKNTQIATAIGNTDEKELYSIRCRNINSRCCWDSRPSIYGGTPLIYNGSLNFQNTNPEKSFCFDVDGDIANSEFTLIIDDNHLELINGNYVHMLGTKETLEIGITFILYVDSDDDKK